MKAVILAGGKGTRLGLTTLPKPMVSVGGLPLIGHQVLLAKKYGIRDIFVLSGHLSPKIVDYLGTGRKFGVNIKHLVENEPLGTAGALKRLEKFLKTDFFLFYGDTMLDVDLKHMAATVLVHPNDHPFDSDLVKVDSDSCIKKIYSKPHRKREYLPNLVSAALYLLSPQVFRHIKRNEKADICQDIFPRLLRIKKKVFAYRSAEYIKDIGTPERLLAVRADFASGIVAAKNRSIKQKAVFLDRDGVVNHDRGRVCRTGHIRIYKDVPSSIRLLNASGYLCIIVTNQPVIAKGFCTFAGLDRIHNKIETLLGEAGCYVDAIYFCPHHPHKGFKGEVENLKFDCGCRKPKPGMLLTAMKDYNIGAVDSFIIGDREEDIMAGKNAGVRTILLKRPGETLCARISVAPDLTVTGLSEAVARILRAEEK
jgi:D,D-heptose 1,7-bisphosphate phosphatase